jgi:hypothetical protein
MQQPWNIPNLSVYSLVSSLNEKSNFNICTYVSAISMKPKPKIHIVWLTEIQTTFARDKAIQNFSSADHIV